MVCCGASVWEGDAGFKPCVQAIQQEGVPSSESDVGRISARLRDKGKDYGEFWGARATGSSDRYEEYTWFIRSVFVTGLQSGSCNLLHLTYDVRGYHAAALSAGQLSQGG